MWPVLSHAWHRLACTQLTLPGDNSHKNGSQYSKGRLEFSSCTYPLGPGREEPCAIATVTICVRLSEHCDTHLGKRQRMTLNGRHAVQRAPASALLIHRDGRELPRIRGYLVCPVVGCREQWYPVQQGLSSENIPHIVLL